MSYLKEVEQNTLKVEIDKIPLDYRPKIDKIIARHEFGRVILFVGTKRVEMSTTTAHKIGYNIAMAKLEPNELIVIIINNQRLELLHPIAIKVSTALLRKADDADDWQLQFKRKLK